MRSDSNPSGKEDSPLIQKLLEIDDDETIKGIEQKTIGRHYQSVTAWDGKLVEGDSAENVERSQYTRGAHS